MSAANGGDGASASEPGADGRERTERGAAPGSDVSPYVNLLDPEWYVDPFDAYRWLRDHSPVHWDPVQRIWGISRHADIVAVEKATQRYSSLDGSRPHTDQRDDRSMINMDDPAHQRQRSLVNRRFTPRAVRDHEAHVRQLVTGLIDDVVDEGGCEASRPWRRGCRR